MKANAEGSSVECILNFSCLQGTFAFSEMRVLYAGRIPLRRLGRCLYHSENGVYGHQPQLSVPQLTKGNKRLNIERLQIIIK